MGDPAIDASLQGATEPVADLPPRALAPAGLAGGKYVLGRMLGRGGAGTVYLAKDRDSGREVALKELRRYDPVHLMRFKEEFRQLADLHHRNLVNLYELVGEGERWFFTMELIEGCSFYDYARGARVNESQDLTITMDASLESGCDFERIRQVVPQLIEGISALHRAGKLHLDIKPSNVLVTESGRVVLLDFGLVRASALDETGRPERGERRAAGTPAYMSPEQAQGDPGLGPPSDWYSAGVMLWEAIVGHLPIDGDTLLETLQRKASEDIPPPSQIVRGVPPEVDALVSRLVARDPALRTPESALRNDLMSMRPSTPVGSVRRNSVKARQRFVGRQQELDVLRAGLQTVLDGAPASLLVHGISGMGKSQLVHEFVKEAADQEQAIVLNGRCYERESVPYKAFDSVIDALARYLMTLESYHVTSLLPRDIHSLARLFPVLQRVPEVMHARGRRADQVDPQGMRARAFTALKDLFSRMGDEQPVLILVDDLQWGDVDSARLVLDLLGPPEPPPILFIGTYRRDEAAGSAFLQEVLNPTVSARAMLELKQVPLNALQPHDAERMARARLGSLHKEYPDLAQQIARESEGIPIFIIELARYRRAQARSRSRDLSPVSLDEALRQRASRLPDQAQRLLETLSVAARPVEQCAALQAANIERGEREVIAALRSAKFVRTHGTRQMDTIETYHDRIRAVVVEGLPEDSLRQQHRQLAAALESWASTTRNACIPTISAAASSRQPGSTHWQRPSEQTTSSPSIVPRNSMTVLYASEEA